MHEEDVKQTLDKVFTAEKTMYNQQLGIEWTAPEDVLLNHVPNENTKEGIEEKIVAGDTTKNLLERLLEGQGNMYQTNIMRIMEAVSKETVWLLDEQNKLNPDRIVR